MEMRTIFLEPGMVGLLAGFRAVVVRHYDGNMYEFRMPGGLACCDASDFSRLQPVSKACIHCETPIEPGVWVGSECSDCASV